MRRPFSALLDGVDRGVVFVEVEESQWINADVAASLLHSIIIHGAAGKQWWDFASPADRNPMPVTPQESCQEITPPSPTLLGTTSISRRQQL